MTFIQIELKWAAFHLSVKCYRLAHKSLCIALDYAREHNAPFELRLHIAKAVDAMEVVL